MFCLRSAEQRIFRGHEFSHFFGLRLFFADFDQDLEFHLAI